MWYRLDPIPNSPRYWPYGATYRWRYLETWEQVMKAIDDLRDQFGKPRALNLPSFMGIEICMRYPERVMMEDRVFYPLAEVELIDGHLRASWVRDDGSGGWFLHPANWDQFPENDPDPATRLRQLLNT